MFQLRTEFSPCGDQPKAIENLVAGVREKKRAQVLLGVTGSGKTFTMANVIAQVQKPTLVIAHNKTLAAQLYQEFKSFFPNNAVEYFVSYYDYYQPEAYIARTDTYIEKDLAINDQIDRMRLSATRSLHRKRRCCHCLLRFLHLRLRPPEYYSQMLLSLTLNQKCRRDDILLHLVEMHYKRNDYDLIRATFRARGDNLEIMPAYEEDLAYRVEFFGDEIERITEIDPLTGKVRQRLDNITIYPGSHHVTPENVRLNAIQTSARSSKKESLFLKKKTCWLKCKGSQQRTRYDLEMIKEIGFCKGIENYSRHFSKRLAGQPPPCLLDYFPEDFFFLSMNRIRPSLSSMLCIMGIGPAKSLSSNLDFASLLPLITVL